MNKKYQLHISGKIKPYPADHEISAALIIATYFKDDVIFIKRSQNSKTADFQINGKIWELKSPIGNGKRTIQNNLRKADRQSPNIILDLRRCKMHSSQAMSKINFELSKAHNISNLIVIQKNQKVIALKQNF